MLTCIACSKQLGDGLSSIDHPPPEGPYSNATPTKQAIRNLSSQIKDMALKLSGSYRLCSPCANQTVGQQRRIGGEWHPASSDQFRWMFKRAGRRELEARLKGISSAEGTPESASRRRVDSVVFVEESEPMEWVAQVEAGVLITFLALPRGSNDLKRIRFSREMFNKWQARRWWAENSEKVMELYNVERLNRQAFPLPSTPRSEDEGCSKTESVEDSPVIPPLGREQLPHTLHRPTGKGTAYSSSDSLDRQSRRSKSNYGSCGAAATPAVSSISGTAKTETSSMDAASDLEAEWEEPDEPGVYITVRALLDGRRELRRVRFCREKFGEIHAGVWWEDNRARILKQYLQLG